MYATYPIYLESLRYAKENNEVELWKESQGINKECAAFIQENASAHNGNKDFALNLAETFGLERAMYICASTIRLADWDMRYDDSVMKRAKEFDYPDNRTSSFYVSTHPCHLNNLFYNLMKMEQEQVNLPQSEQPAENEHDEGAEI